VKRNLASSLAPLQDWFDRRRGLSAAMVLAMPAAVTVTTSCDNSPRNPELANGWVTKCSGPEFSRFSQAGSSGPGPDRPVFKINNQLVLAVPKENWPSANGIESAPRECRKISDLPAAAYLYFVIQGNWSAGYQPGDIPIVGGTKMFLPDIVTVRVERSIPSKFSEEEQQKIKRVLSEARQEISTGTREIGGLTCLVPKPPMNWFNCNGNRTAADSDITHLRFREYPSTPFVLISADYDSSHDGGIHVSWQAWILDPSHALDVDRAVWNSLADWNLVTEPENKIEPH
jgi:hypothetical protein